MSAPRIGAIIQARMSSSRLPGKVLHPVAGKPLLGYLVDSLRQVAGLDAIVVATSDEVSDDPVALFCREHGVGCHRGSLEFVSRRMLDAADIHGLEGFVRVCGDSPLMDCRLVEHGVARFVEAGVDLVTNVFPNRTFPKGQSIEVVSTRTMRAAWNGFATPEDHEHVTGYFYARADEFAILSFESGEPLGEVQLSVDTPEDMAMFTRMVEAMDRLHWEYSFKEMVELREACA